MSDLEIIMGGIISAYAVGWGVGYGIKMYRRFFDSL